jgi:hypothetical protein
VVATEVSVNTITHVHGERDMRYSIVWELHESFNPFFSKEIPKTSPKLCVDGETLNNPRSSTTRFSAVLRRAALSGPEMGPDRARRGVSSVSSPFLQMGSSSY